MYNYGYMGFVCILMVFNDVWEKGLFKQGDLVFFVGFGGGLVFVSVVFCL